MTGVASAQLEIRPHAGFNIQNLTESVDGTEWKGTTGYQFGGHIMIGNQFFIQPGIQYVVSKSELSATSASGPIATFTLTTGSLRVPAVIGYRFSDPSSEPFLNLRLFGGLAANFPLSSTFDEEGVEDVEVGPANFALTAGAGLDISIFFVDLGYDIGMSNIFNDEDFDVDTKQNQLQVSAGVRLKFAQ
jgi:hypothetical protein